MKVMDPICRMEIESELAAYKSEYKGKMYYFCGESCKKRFDENPEKYLKAVDPICRMEVDSKLAAYKSEYKGKTYYFCSEPCKKRFDVDPEKYIQAERI